MQEFIIKRVLVLALTIVISTPIFAKVYFVATNGNDTNIGTKDQPFATVQKAQMLVNAGDTV